MDARRKTRILFGGISGLAVGGAGGAVANGLLNNLVAYWALDEAAGANDALDKHGGGLTLTQASSPGSAAGKVYAGARTFDGSADYFSRAAFAECVFGNTDFAWAVWVYATTLAASYTAVNYGGASYGLTHDLAQGKWRMYVSPNGGSTIANVYAGVPATDTWTLVIGQHDAANNLLLLSVNGAASEQVDTTGTAPAVVTSTLYVGSYNGSLSMWPGRLGPIATWSRLLTVNDISALYNGGAGLAYSAFTA